MPPTPTTSSSVRLTGSGSPWRTTEAGCSPSSTRRSTPTPETSRFRAPLTSPTPRPGSRRSQSLTELIERYDRLHAPKANAVVGRRLSGHHPGARTKPGSRPLGAYWPTLIWRRPVGPDTGNAVVAFMNPGGIRDNITFASSGPEADGELTYGEAFSVHPFGNSLVTMTLTGAQIDALLEQQFRRRRHRLRQYAPAVRRVQLRLGPGRSVGVQGGTVQHLHRRRYGRTPTGGTGSP